MDYLKSSKQGKFLISKTIFESPRFHISNEKHELSNNTTHDFITVHAPNWVSIIPLDDEGNLVMIWQYRPAWRRSSLEFPAGRLNYENEDSLEAAKRELQEETGYVAKNWHLIGRNKPVTWTTQDVAIFEATDLEFTQTNFDDEEDIEVVRIKPEEFWDKVKKNDIIDGPTIASWTYWKQNKSEK